MSKEHRNENMQDADNVPANAEDSGIDRSGQNSSDSPMDELANLTAECNDLRDKLMRAQAECANISKRLTQQHHQAMRTAGLELARALLPVLDNLERTVEAGQSATDAKSIVDGVQIVKDDFAKVFREFGVAPIESVGQHFDPKQHEALFQDFESELPAGTVSQELQRGFVMHDRVLRPAKVAVSADKSGAENDANSAQEETSVEK